MCGTATELGRDRDRRPSATVTLLARGTIAFGAASLFRAPGLPVSTAWVAVLSIDVTPVNEIRAACSCVDGLTILT
jgi:hypothetical protein